MAQYTTNYKLHQWEPEDDFLRTDFNQDFAKIDTAIKAVEAKEDAAVSTLDSKLTNGLAQAAKDLASGLAQRPYVAGQISGLQTTTSIRTGFRPAFGLLIGSKFMAITIGDQMQYRFDNIYCGSLLVSRSTTGLSFSGVTSTMINDIPIIYYVFFKV